MLTRSCHLVWAFSAILSLVTCTGESKPNHIRKRDVADNFEVLLNIYKMNPLKRSTLYKKFSKRMLVPNRMDRHAVLNFDSNESAKERRVRTSLNLKQIEEAIHVRQPKNTKIMPPAYTVKEFAPEKFSTEITLKDLERMKKFKLKKNNITENFNNLFEHIGSFVTHNKEKKHVQRRITAKPPIIRIIPTDTNPNYDIFGDIEINEKFNKITYSNEEVVVLR